MRLMHPYLQSSASHAPTSTRTNVAARTGVNADSTTQQQRVVARTAETALTGHMAVPRLPQLDVSWIRNRREGVAAAVERSIARNARMTFDREHYSVYGAYGDTRQQSDVTAAREHPAVAQRRRQLPALADRELVAGVPVRLRLGARRHRQPQALEHVEPLASVTSDWRPKPWLTPSLNYQWRRSRPASSVVAPQTDQDGAFPVRAARYAARASAPAAASARSACSSAAELLKYATAVAAADGELRHGLAVNNTSASHTTSWDPSRGTYGSETIASALRASFGRSAQWDASWQLSANGDTGSVSQRY